MPNDGSAFTLAVSPDIFFGALIPGASYSLTNVQFVSFFATSPIGLGGLIEKKAHFVLGFLGLIVQNTSLINSMQDFLNFAKNGTLSISAPSKDVRKSLIRVFDLRILT